MRRWTASGAQVRTSRKSEADITSFVIGPCFAPPVTLEAVDFPITPAATSAAATDFMGAVFTDITRLSCAHSRYDFGQPKSPRSLMSLPTPGGTHSSQPSLPASIIASKSCE